MKFPILPKATVLPLCLALTILQGSTLLHAQATGGIAPRSLLPENDAQVTSDKPDDPVKATVTKDGIDVVIQSGTASYPGIAIQPPQGAKTWDLSAFGHVDARITNTGSKLLALGVRVDNAGDWKDNPWNTEMTRIKPGESQTIKIYFGYSYGGKPAYKLNTAAITRLLFFIAGKAAEETTFKINEIWASGSTGDKPPVDPNSVRIKPENGVIFGAAVKFDPAKQLSFANGAQASVDAATKGLKIAFAGGKKDESVTIKPPMGAWSLTDVNEVRVKVKNTGQSTVTPSARVTSGAATDTFSTKSPLAPNAEGEIVVSFTPAVPAVVQEKSPGKFDLTPGTGTSFASGNVKGITIFSDGTAGAKSLEVLSITGDAPPATMPAWLGTKPPVDGAWVKTFDDEFDGKSIDLTKWNIYAANFWDKRTHFTKDDIILKDGKAIFHYEKKTGHHNDDPAEKETDYACGFADSYGKWTQRYGYFEVRVKLPTAPGLWPAFWLMPDRGIGKGPQWKRGSTDDGGMEFDIMEFLSGWGPYRYNVANHFDGYGKNHKANGSTSNYVQADKDGYITSGMLWTPGKVVYYCNGKEILTWENPRVSNVASHMILDVVSGGWDNLPLEDAKLPDDFIVDYVRVWQRKDLASDVDGPKPNDGGPKAPVDPAITPAPAK